MKKFIIVILCLFLFTGCSKTGATYEVESYLNKFKNHDKEVISSLDELLRLESITEEQKELYEHVMKKQYTDLEYKIKDEYFDGDEATYKVDITVYDYTESKRRANKEIEKNPDAYSTEEKKMNEQLEQMKKETKRINYTLTFKLYYVDDRWVLQTPNTEVLEKIHGIYEYELNG